MSAMIHAPTVTGGSLLPKLISAEWEPKADITTFEIAQVLPCFSTRSMTVEQWETLGDGQRHWKRTA